MLGGAFIEELNEIVYQLHYKLSGEKEELLLSYEPNIEDIFFEDELSRAKVKDMKLCQTTVGPHRDDMLFSIKGVDIRKFGSQGQQRTSALSLKLSEIELVKQSIHETPILLLDDVLSELDSNRQNYLLNSIHETQTLITCTGLDEFVRNRFQLNKVFQVINGEVFDSIPNVSDYDECKMCKHRGNCGYGKGIVRKSISYNFFFLSFIF